MAESDRLDEWMRHRSLIVKTGEHGSRLKERTIEQAENFLWTELETARNFVRLARSALTPDAALRRTKAARKAYDSIQAHLGNMRASELKQFNTEVSELRRELAKLGEVF